MRSSKDEYGKRLCQLSQDRLWLHGQSEGSNKDSRVNLTVNGRLHNVSSLPDTPLIYVLRNELGLMATKLGCALEQCGACMVVVDGKTVYSCTEPISAFAQKSIHTAEGLADTPAGQRLRAALDRHAAAQCGYCTAGIFVSLVSLTERDRAPSETTIREALQPHLCRCGSHARVLRAAREAVGAA